MHILTQGSVATVQCAWWHLESICVSLWVHRVKEQIFSFHLAESLITVQWIMFFPAIDIPLTDSFASPFNCWRRLWEKTAYNWCFLWRLFAVRIVTQLWIYSTVSCIYSITWFKRVNVSPSCCNHPLSIVLNSGVIWDWRGGFFKWLQLNHHPILQTFQVELLFAPGITSVAAAKQGMQNLFNVARETGGKACKIRLNKE